MLCKGPYFSLFIDFKVIFSVMNGKETNKGLEMDMTKM